jgi:subtilisin family serine protease
VVAWGVDEIDADRVWEELGVTGEGVVVGIADSGVDWTHPALQDSYLGADGDHTYTWFDPWEGTTEPTDAGGHGTHTTGTVLGNNGIGVAPDAEWIACRNLARNLGDPAYYLDCMQFLLAPFPADGDPFTEGDPSRGADLTSNSWGCPPEEGCDGLTLPIAINHLHDAGQLFVVSAGNEGPQCGTVDSPAIAEDALTVGAVDPSGRIASFSSRGPALLDDSGRIKPDVAAPGVNVLSSRPGGDYGVASGTSMAGPHVAGLAALMWSANPELIGDVDATVQIIEGTAIYEAAPDLCGAAEPDDNNLYGHGRIDALDAVQQALSATP